MDIKNNVATVAQMKEFERLADEAGLSYYQMMENAGTAASEFILSTMTVQNKSLLIFCGKGNNGGDGFVVARKMFEKGARVNVIEVDGEPKTMDAIKNKQLCESLNVPVHSINEKDVDELVKRADIIIDAIYGTGFDGALNEMARRATRLINSSNVPVFALDIPSGVNGDTGEADKDTVLADYTIAFHRYKPAHGMELKNGRCGELICMDIGIDRALRRSAE